MKELIENELKEAHQLLEKFLSDPATAQSIEKAVDLMVTSILEGKKIISCGNGGSMSDAMHFAEELSGRYRGNRPSIPAVSISDPTHITCVGNDYGFDYIFSRYIEGLGQPGDVLLGISTSGNSKNIIEAVAKAKEKGLRIILLTGKDGGKLANAGDVEIRVPHFGFADRIQEIHIKVIHIFILLIEKKLGY
ncbi:MULTISPECIES: D-sedoheptulose 7-phosphate isomerase [unclassified Imperialibacter]|uniref:D-sedoheptulose 7-phosphate isomerase n=1 Tax=unclassified Imperialibacter TaxID=2629706 RepID=UPI0012596D9A|nr:MULTISPECIES: D-sedoheptulose 7-phosphate isomerase [unclassified Imperialibacter]CAD5271978.1 D-sedoheptulose 7-phosphate isomerase [Imperialibacter sp. 89]CAD5299152.1 D-sedoheptulose 7-phosphate isomerase [Imperialibacter sp. 75]VVT35150.1 D-sedoheptulose 7-phosphate isomerase [Imperialibacter sp. EC-SDR9]